MDHTEKLDSRQAQLNCGSPHHRNRETSRVEVGRMNPVNQAIETRGTVARPIKILGIAGSLREGHTTSVFSELPPDFFLHPYNCRSSTLTEFPYTIRIWKR
jgi:hypothetical protein